MYIDIDAVKERGEELNALCKELDFCADELDSIVREFGTVKGKRSEMSDRLGVTGKRIIEHRESMKTLASALTAIISICEKTERNNQISTDITGVRKDTSVKLIKLTDYVPEDILRLFR